MENQKIINLLDKIDTDPKHFATKKWYFINDENNTNYGVDKNTGENAPDTIKYDTRVLKPNLCDYAEAYILVNGTIRAAEANANTRLALKNCAPFTKCNLEINAEHVDTAENLDITMPMYNLIEYSDNYQDSSATLYQYKRDEPPEDNAIDNLTTDNSSSFKYKVKLLGNPVPDDNIAKRNVKVVVPLKYLSNFFRSLEMPLINCKIKLNLTWKKECVLSNQAGAAVFIINDTKMYVPVVQSGGFLRKLLSKLAGPLMKVAMPLAKNVLAPLGLTAAMSAIDGSMQNKIHGSGVKLIIEEEDMKDIMKIIETLENSGILLKEVGK